MYFASLCVNICSSRLKWYYYQLAFEFISRQIKSETGQIKVAY